MIIVGGVLMSLLGIGMRVMDDPESFRILFYRSLAQCLFLCCVVVYMHGRNSVAQFTSMGSKGLLAACLIASAGLFMVTSLANTTVANAVFIISLAPLCSAFLGMLFLNERVSRRTWLAMSIALIGIALIFGDGLSSGGLFGMFLAFMMMFCYSSAIITIRSQVNSGSRGDVNGAANIVAVCALNAFILMLAVSPFVPDFALSTKDLLICLFLGVFQIGLGMVLVTVSSQYVPAAQVSLLALLEVILSPIWVWIGVGEVPSTYALVGGAIVLCGVILQALNRDAASESTT